MRTWHWLIVVLATAGLAGLGGYLLAPDPEASEPIDDSPSPQAPSGPLADALRSVPPLHAGQGDGMIEGAVYGADGKPLSGVKVSAVPSADGGSLWPQVSMTNEEFWKDVHDDVKELVRQRRAYQMPHFSATTNAEGHYRITGLPMRDFVLRAELAGYVFELVNGRTFVAPNALQDFVGTQAVTVHVVVKSPDGKEVRPGRLVVNDIVEQRQVTPFFAEKATEWTLQLPAGCYSMQVSMEGPDMRSAPQTVVVQPSDNTQEVVIEFDAGHGLQVVVDPGRIAPTTLHLTCVPDSPGADPAAILHAELKKPMRHSRNWKSTFSGLSVQFEFLRKGNYVVGAFGFGQLVAWTRVQYDGESGRASLALVTPPADDCIVCTINTQIHRPLYPRFTIEREGATRSELVPWRMDALTYRLQLPPRDKFDRDTAGTLYLRDDRAGEAQVELATCGPQDVKVEFQAQSYLLLEWDEAQFEPTSSPTAKLFDEQGEEVRAVRVSRADQGGSGIVLSNFYPGRYSLRVYAPDAQFPMYAADFDPEPGFNHVQIVLVELSSIEILLKDQDIQSVELSIEMNGSLVAQRLNHFSSSATLTGLAPGTYKVIYRKAFDDKEHSSHFFAPRSDPVVLE